MNAIPNFPRSFHRISKRGLDVLGALVLMVLLAPVMLIIWGLIYVRMGSPVLFRQVRPGLDAHPFTVVKYRTMIDAYDPEGNPLPDIQRVTPLGRILRRASLDELPQLWNVLMGEMSFVGPRPLLMEYITLYSPEQRRRLDVKPGITGLAQVSGRNNIPWEDRLRLDVDYVDKASLWFDLVILARTIKYVLFSRSVHISGVDQVHKFQGTLGNSPKQLSGAANIGTLPTIVDDRE